jgi:hypothetical protein
MASLVTAQGATITVTSASDGGPGSLREAILLSSSGDEIQFDPALANVPIQLTSGQLVVQKNLSINGLGRDKTILDGSASSRVFRVLGGFSVTIGDLTIQNGAESGSASGVAEGGGIYNEGTLSLSRCAVSHNRVGSLAYPSPLSSVRGGGILNLGRLRLNHCLVSQNTADFLSRFSFGGGIYNSGEAIIEDSTLSENSGVSDLSAGLVGIAIFNDVLGTMALSGTHLTRNGQGYSFTITNRGTLSIISTSIVGAESGALDNQGTCVVVATNISNNRTGINTPATGIWNRGIITVEESTVAFNEGENCAGIFNGGPMLLINSTVFQNDSFRKAGAIWNRAQASVVGCTIVGNRSGYDFGGIASEEGSLLLKNSLVAANRNYNDTQLPDCGGNTVSGGNNLVEHPCGTGEGVSKDIVGFDWSDVLESEISYGQRVPLLSNNGGETRTVALLPDSLATDRVASVDCTDDEGSPLTTDQRGVARPQGPACDIGAFEFSQSRDTVFWLQQCRQNNSAEYSPDRMSEFFAAINEKSDAFPECAAASCAALEPGSPRNSWKDKAARELLSVWLNLASGRLTNGRPINLIGLTTSATVGTAVVEVERTVCNTGSTRQDLAHAKDIAEALSQSGD